MTEFENIPKNDFFRVPENYFADLPREISARIESAQPATRFQGVLRYSMICLAAAGLTAAMLFFLRPARQDVESILASVGTTELIEYLRDSDVTTEELLQSNILSDEQIEALELDAFMFDSPSPLPDSN